jgi:peptide-methionine (S)-S-oxide reductase
MNNNCQNPTLQTATIGGGCFWCIDAVFREIDGVTGISSGFAGGEEANPSYELACSGTTGHIEVVQLTFDPQTLPYEQLLAVFFAAHDPTQVNGQGNDIGPQYRSVIFYHDEQQQHIAQTLMDEMTSAQLFEQQIVTELRPYMPFYPAPEGHQDFYRNRPGVPYCQIIIRPKVEKIRQLFKQRIID